jgi:hypothetical protein
MVEKGKNMKKPFHQSKLSLILIVICVSFALTQCKLVVLNGARGYHGSNSINSDTDHHFSLYLCSTTHKDGLGIRPDSYKEFENKIIIPKWKKGSCPIEKTCWSKDKYPIYPQALAFDLSSTNTSANISTQ